MGAPDIMQDNENETDKAIEMLSHGDADCSLRDRVLVALLRAQTKMLEDLLEIKNNLWGVERLEQLIDRRHQALCANCPSKQLLSAGLPQRQQAPEKKSWVELVLTSESLRYFLLMVILVWAIVYVKSGTEGVDRVHEGLVHTMTGGVK